MVMEKAFDLLLKNGRIVDGSGNSAYSADIAIKAGRIELIKKGIQPESGVQVIDVDQQVISPGFIDTHTHDDLLVLLKPTADEKILQGVTSVVTGNCGFSMAPLGGDRENYIKTWIARQGGKLENDDLFSIKRLSDYIEKVEEAKPGINVIPLAGHGTIRMSVMGLEQRCCNEKELDRMKGMLKEALEDGAFGLSTGLIYPPGMYSTTEEVIELSKVAVSSGGLYATHMRNEGRSVLKALDEAIRVGADASIPVHISHHKVSSPEHWGMSSDTLAKMTKARANGQMVTCDQYPYRAGCTTLMTLLPAGFLALGPDQWSKELQSPATRKEVRKAIEAEDDYSWQNMLWEVGFSNIRLSSSLRHQEFLGCSLAQIAEKQGKSEYDALFDMLTIEKSQAAMFIFSMGEEDVIQIMKSPYTMIGSDGDPDFGNNLPHPRLTGTFPKVLRKYVRETHVLELEEAIRKMTSLPAGTFGIKQKGLIAEGYDADLVIFDPAEIADRSDFKSPKLSPVGIQYVLVNGGVAVDHGRVTGVASGTVLRRGINA